MGLVNGKEKRGFLSLIVRKRERGKGEYEIGGVKGLREGNRRMITE